MYYLIFVSCTIYNISARSAYFDPYMYQMHTYLNKFCQILSQCATGGGGFISLRYRDVIVLYWN